MAAEGPRAAASGASTAAEALAGREGAAVALAKTGAGSSKEVMDIGALQEARALKAATGGMIVALEAQGVSHEAAAVGISEMTGTGIGTGTDTGAKMMQDRAAAAMSTA